MNKLIVSLVLVLVVVLAACGDHSGKLPNISKVDTVYALVRPAWGGYMLDTALRTIKTINKLDTASNEGKWSYDTTYQLRINGDTAKNGPHLRVWSNSLTDTMVQPITIPHTPYTH